MGNRRHQDDRLAVGEHAGREATHRAIEKLLILIKLHDVIARRRIGQKPAPQLLPVERTVAGRRCGWVHC